MSLRCHCMNTTLIRNEGELKRWAWHHLWEPCFAPVPARMHIRAALFDFDALAILTRRRAEQRAWLAANAPPAYPVRAHLSFTLDTYPRTTVRYLTPQGAAL